MSDIAQIIMWCLNDNFQLNIENLDEDEIYTLCCIHKLQAALLNRINKTKTQIFSKRFTAKLSLDLVFIKNRNNVILSTIESIDLVCGSGSAIAIKGINAHLLTGKYETLRQSADIDILSEDPDELKKRLLQCGFSEVNESCDWHEHSKLFSARKNTHIEIHKYFPVLAKVRANRLETKEISFSDLRGNSITITSSNNRRITISRYEMCALIACSHIFKDFAWEPFNVPTFKFEEVIEVYEICRHPRFDKKVFINLVEKFNAYDAVAFVSALIDNFYSQLNPLRFMGFEVTKDFKISNGLFGSWLTSNDSMFFSKLLTCSSFTFLLDLKCNFLEYNREHIISTKSLAKVIRNTDTNRVCDFSFKVEMAYDKLSFTFYISDPLHDRDNICIHFGNAFCHFIMFEDINRKNVYGNGECSLRLVEDSYIANILINTDELLSNDNSIQLMISVEVKYQDGWVQTTVPLSLSFNGEGGNGLYPEV